MELLLLVLSFTGVGKFWIFVCSTIDLSAVSTFQTDYSVFIRFLIKQFQGGLRREMGEEEDFSSRLQGCNSSPFLINSFLLCFSVQLTEKLWQSQRKQWLAGSPMLETTELRLSICRFIPLHL
jgi:hypothetical protein